MIRDMSYKIAICDDDIHYAEYLKELITGLLEAPAEFYVYQSGEALLKEADEEHDAVFMDIQLGGMNGTETARKLRKTNKNAVLAFCSGAVNPTPESIKVTPYRYLLKQYDEKTMRREIKEVLDKMVKSFKEEYILAQSENRILRIYVNDITYISKIKRGSKLHLINPSKYEVTEDVITQYHAKELYQRLSRLGFEFAHDSYLVNCRWVVWFGRTYLNLEGGIELNISRSKHELFQKRLIKYWDKYRGGNDGR